MSIAYEREDPRRLITVTVTEPYSVDDILGVIDRQAAEGTWEYALLYDLRDVTREPAEADLQQMAERVRVVSGGRARGQVGIAIRARSAQFLAGLLYIRLTRELMAVEVLLSEVQVDAWLARNARGGVPRHP